MRFVRLESNFSVAGRYLNRPGVQGTGIMDQRRQGQKPMRALLSVLLVFLSTLVFSAEPDAAAKQEIAHLLEYISQSDCQFDRNGSWHGSADAAAHVKMKYEYLLRRGFVNSAEDFISRAASESSMTGKAYQLQCGAGAPVQVGTWLRAELARYRSAGRPPAINR
jgi:hypothetical protein